MKKIQKLEDESRAGNAGQAGFDVLCLEVRSSNDRGLTNRSQSAQPAQARVMGIRIGAIAEASCQDRPAHDDQDSAVLMQMPITGKVDQGRAGQ